MSAVQDLRISELHADALKLAPAFRNKLDFSDPKDYERLAEYAFSAAKAIRTKADELFSEASKKDEEAAIKALKEAEVVRLKAVAFTKEGAA